MFTDDEPMDRDDHDAFEAHQFDSYLDRLLRDYDDARAALKTLRPGMDRSERWHILDRAYRTAQALELERTRVPFRPYDALAELRRGAA